MARAAVPVRLQRPRVRRRLALAGREVFGGAPVAKRVEERAVRVLRAVREVAGEPVQHDRRPVVADGEGVPPEPEREPERDGRDRDRVQALARRVLVLPGHADHDRVERLLERRRAAGDPAQERLGVRDRRWAGERSDGGQLAAEILQQPPPDPGRQQREAAQRRAGELGQRVVLVRVATEAAREARRVQHERGPEHRHAVRERSLERDAELPASRGSRLEQRVRRRRAQRLGAAGAEQGAGAAVEHGLGGGDAEDEIRLDEERVDAQRRSAGVSDVDEVGRLGVVHLDPAVKAAGERRREQRLELALAGSPVEPAGDEDRLARGRDAEPLQLVDRGGERVAARIAGRARKRQLGRLDDERRRAAARDERLERRAREREAERIAYRGGDVDDALGGPPRPQHDAVARIDDRDARSGRDRNPHQAVGWTSRRRRRCVGLKPRLGQKRDASRFVERQSSSTVSKPARCASWRACSASATPSPAPRASGLVPATGRCATPGRSPGVEGGVAEGDSVALRHKDHRGLVVQEVDPVVPHLFPLGCP